MLSTPYDSIGDFQACAHNSTTLLTNVRFQPQIEREYHAVP